MHLATIMPQAPLTPRHSNPSAFRNLDAGRGPIGYAHIDLTALEPSLHTIAWSVTDSGGRTEGIGSRFFRVFSGEPRRAPDRARSEARQFTTGETGRRIARRQNCWCAPGSISRPPIEALSPTTREHAVTIPSTGRVELQLGPVTGGQLAGDGALALPIGSRLDRESGVFTWVPPPGYLGTYRLVFDRADGPFTLVVTVEGSKTR